MTAAQYFHFLVSLGREGLTNEKLRDGWWGGKDILQVGDRELAPDRARRPLNVAWEAARLYCEWAGKRLPTSAEWEFAARFDPERKRARLFPWGDRFDEAASGCDRSPSPRDFPAKGVDVGLFDGRLRADGQSPTGVHDLFGSADEWVADSCPYYPETCHLRRGRVHCVNDSLATETAHYYHSGFRCAADLNPRTYLQGESRR